MSLKIVSDSKSQEIERNLTTEQEIVDSDTPRHSVNDEEAILNEPEPESTQEDPEIEVS
jgi:antitoxin component of MazEF toxin-antitoxin module